MAKLIYLFEDEPTLAAILQAKLKTGGYEVAHAINGAQGLELIKRKAPDLLILNVRMPVMSGLDVLAVLRNNEQFKRLPVIVVSNSASEEEAKALKELGVQDYLIKTDFEPGELIRKVDAYFSEQGGTSQKEEEKSVLLVEDDAALREIVSRQLVRAGFKVSVATEGEEALKEIGKQRPHLILLDLLLPGMSGFELLKRLRENASTKDTPVIILSNFAEKEDMELGKQYGVHDYLAKTSFFPEDIVGKVNAVLMPKE